MATFLGRVRCTDNAVKFIDGAKACDCAQTKPGVSSTQKFIQASNALRHRSTDRKAPTADQLARMTPTQRFIAQSRAMRGR